MVQNKQQLLISSSEAYQDMRRSTAMWLTPSYNELCEERRIVEEDDEMDESYKNLVLCLLSTDEISESQNEEKDEDDHDDCSSEETDPECRHFLQHVKPRGESFVLEYEKEGVLVVSKYGDMCSDEECESRVECYEGELDGAAEHGKLCGSVETNLNKCKAVINGKAGGVTGRKRGTPRKLSRVENLRGNIPRSSSSSVKKDKNVRRSRNVDRTVLNRTVVDRTDLRLTRSMTCTIGPKNRRKNIPPSPPAKKTNARTKSKNEAQIVKISRDEYLHLRQNVKPEDDRSAGMLNEKIYGVNDRTKQKRRKLSRCTNEKMGLSSQTADVENRRKHDSIRKTKSPIITKSKNKNDKVEKYLGQEVKIEGGRCVYTRNGHTVVKKMARVQNQHRHDLGPTSFKMLPVQNQQDHVKLSGVTNQTPRAENQRKRGRPPKSVRTRVSAGVRKSRNVPKEREIKRCSSCEFMNAKACTNINGINIKTEGEDESSPENVDAYPFVCSKRFVRNIDGDGSKKRDGSSVSNKFRNRLLSVLKKPYDREEYFKHSEALRSGQYVDYYPGVQRKLTRYRFKLPRRLTILRGFFFWLQYLTLEGAFQPWKDRECLAVVPGSPVKPSTSKNYSVSRSRKQKQ